MGPLNEALIAVRKAAAVPIRPRPTTPKTRPRNRRTGAAWVWVHGPLRACRKLLRK